jgi:glycosyltransferase involved in cell wall biosynthesis
MKLRLCLIIPTLDQGGAEKQLCLLARGLDREQFDVHVIVLTRTGPRESELLEAGIPVYAINKRWKIDPFAWLRLRTLLKKLKPEIVHTWLFAANAYGRTAAMFAKVKTIIGSERSVDPWKNGMQLAIDRWIGKRTQGVTANSQGTIDFYVQRGLEASWFHLIPNGIEQPTFDTITREEAFRRMGIPTDKKVIVSVGRLWPQKGYKDLIWSAELLWVMRQDVSYVIIGEGPERNRLEQYRDQVLAAGHVHFLGERSDVHQLLPHCDLLWNGSLYEGQSNVIMEAMLAGVPVIATDIPGNRELITHEHSGLLVPVGGVEPLSRWTNRLLNDSELRKSLVANAQSRMQSEHSVAKMVERHAEYYRAKVKER